MANRYIYTYNYNSIELTKRVSIVVRRTNDLERCS